MVRAETEAQRFYGTMSARPAALGDILGGRIIKINPALITITDGLVATTPPELLQRRVREQVRELLKDGKVHTFHLDVNYEDYKGFGRDKPEINTSVFTPPFVTELNELVLSSGAFLNLHLLTDHPGQRLREFEDAGVGAVCFQAEVIDDVRQLEELVERIVGLGACASPVIEAVGSETFTPPPQEEVLAFLEPVLPRVGMLTVQAAGTASRSNTPAGTFDSQRVRSYLAAIGRRFEGAIQLQGGIGTDTVAEAAELGAEFLVCGTEIFRNRDGLRAPEVIDRMLEEAARGLAERCKSGRPERPARERR